MQDRRAILAQQVGAALVDDGTSRGAQAELLGLVLAHLSRNYPSRFALRGEGSEKTFESQLEGLSWRVPDYASAPLLLAGQLVQEDVCLMREEPPQEGERLLRHVFASGLVTDSFDPVAKHMLPMLELHEPVPGFAADMHASMSRVFGTLRKPLWRANFSFYAWRYEGEEDIPAEEMTCEQIVERLCLKVEYETLRRLPEHSDYLVFTIRAHMDPLASFAATPRACAALAAQLRSMPDALLEYKGLGDTATRGAVLSFLDTASNT